MGRMAVSRLYWVRSTQRTRAALRHAAPLLAILFVSLPVLWISLSNSGSLRVDVGAWGDHAYLSGINAVEQSATESYRWTTGAAELVLPNLDGSHHALVFRAHAWRPGGGASPPVTLTLAGVPGGSFQTSQGMRVYRVLLPHNPVDANVRVAFHLPPYTSPSDQRELGLALDWLELQSLARAAPSLWQFAGQGVLVLLGLLLISVLRLPRLPMFMCALLVPIALIAANVYEPLWVSSALGAWLFILAGGFIITWALQRRVCTMLLDWLSPAQAQTAWALLVAALLIRLLGASHPLFDMHDLPYHTGWLDMVGRGNLYIYSTPSEFQNRQTFNPPAGYLLLLPLQLVLDSPRLVVQLGVALLDTLGCFLVLLIARELGLSGRAGLLALACSLALPISLTMLWWGFATNALAQPLWLVLVWLLLRLVRRPTNANKAFFAVAVVVSVLVHVGALTLIAATLGIAIAISWLGLAQPSRFALLASLGTAAVVVAALYFSAVAPTVLAQRVDPSVASLGDPGASNQTPFVFRWPLFWRGLTLGFTPFGLALAPFGLAMLLRGPYVQRVLILSWLGVVAAAVAAYFGLGLVVRDLYFAAPLVCLALGAALNALWARGGRIVVLAIVLIINFNGLALWFGGVLMRIKPSAAPLTR